MSFKAEGFDEAKKGLNDIIASHKPEVFRERAEKIERTARELCKDQDGKRITVGYAKMKVDMRIADPNARACLIQAIKTHLSSMPPTLKVIYERFITKLESESHW
jgi:hypothetical protein